MISYRTLIKLFVPVSVVLVATSIVLFFVPGPEISIEFTGGTLMEVELPEGATKDGLVEALNAFVYEPPLGNVAVSSTKDGTALIRMRDIGNEEHLALLAHLQTALGEFRELQYTTIGPTVGTSLKIRSLWALAIACVAIVLYLAFAFRKVPRSLSPWRFGISTIVALVHDIIIMMGLFTVISRYTSFEVDTLFVTALLSIMGYSVSDTIVIFDRIRDNLAQGGKHEEFAVVAARALYQSLSRTINTGLGALIMLFALLFLGPQSLRWFVLALITGTIIGTYSSFFVATPLLIFWKKKN